MPRADDEVRTMDLRLFIDIVRRRAWQIALVTLAVIVVALALTYLRPDLYTSVAVVEVQPLTYQDFGTDASTGTNMETEAARVTQEEVARDAHASLRRDPDLGAIPERLDRLTDAVAVTVQPGTSYLEIACTLGSPLAAQRCAQAFADGYEVIRDEQAITRAEAVNDTPGQPTVTANPDAADVASPAVLPNEASNKSYVVVLAVAMLLGVLLGIGIALLRERLAEPVTDRGTFAEALVAPVLAVVPDAPRRWKGAESAAMTLAVPGGPASEAYRIARTTLQHVSRRSELKVFAVAGLDGGADATKTTAELAIALAQGGRQVAAVSANLRKPGLNRLLGVGSSIGLASVLTGEADLDEALLPTHTPGLQVIASGLTSDLPPELLDTDQMRAVVKELRSSFDFLLLDTAPQPWAADTLSLVPLTDGVIVTASAGRTLRDDVTRLRLLVEGVGGQIAGGILKERPSRSEERSPVPRGTAPRRPPEPTASRSRHAKKGDVEADQDRSEPRDESSEAAAG